MKVLVAPLLLVLLQSCCATQDVIFSSPASIFQSGVPFIGHYVGSSNVDNIQWSSPEFCSQTTIASNIEQFLCSTSGDVVIEVTYGSDSQNFKLNIERNSVCYTWGMEFNDKSVSFWVKNSSGQSDPNLSFEFYALGESPKVTMSCDKNEETLPRGEFDFETNQWVLRLGNAIESYTHMRVSGLPVLLNGCSVADLVTPIFEKRLPEQKSSESAKSSTLKVCSDYCGSGVTVYLNNTHVLISADRMETSELLYLDHTVIDCGVMMSGTVLLLVENGEKLLILEDFTLSKSIKLGISAEHITVNTKCVKTLETNHNSSLVVLWNSSKMSILYGTNIIKTISSLPESMSEISAVTVSYFGTELVLRDENDSKWFSYNHLTESFSSGVKLSVDCLGGCKLRRVCPHINWLEANGTPFFVASNGRSVSSVRSYTSGEILTKNVFSIAISPKDEFAMIATDGALYLGYCSRSSVIKIAEGFSHARGLLFDSISELYFIDDIGRSINIPTKILLEEVLDSNACFLKDFQSSLSSSLMYLDKGETQSYNISLTTTNYETPGLLYQLYPQGHALVNISSVFDASKLAFGENHFFKSIDIAGLDKKGLSVIIASPEVVHPQCSAKLTDVTYVVVDCPKSRHLEIQNKPRSCNQYDNMSMTYSIPGRFRSENKPKTVDYDLEELGCPIIWAYDEEFLPDVWIYDGDVPTRQLCSSDFTVREVNGRSDFNFTLSVEEVGCRRAPQTWQSEGENWGPENYRDCFQSEKKEIFTKSEAGRQYEILNVSCSTTGLAGRLRNMMSFGKHKANYTFELIVLDPTASYCRLSTKFSVWILDAPNASDLGIIVLFLACLVMLIILALSYCHYKKTILTKANMVLQS